MSEDMTTRRAIEICMSRVPMDKSTTYWLSSSLQKAIRNETPAPAGDVDAMRAALLGIIETATGCADFPRAALVARLSIVREQALRALGEAT